MNIAKRSNVATKNIVLLYHDDDVKWRDEMFKHLVLMRRQGLISIVESTNEETLPNLDIIIVLITSNLMSDDKILNAIDYIYAHNIGRVILILVQDVDLSGHIFEGKKLLPRNGVPIQRCGDRNQEFAKIALEIRALVTK